MDGAMQTRRLARWARESFSFPGRDLTCRHGHTHTHSRRAPPGVRCHDDSSTHGVGGAWYVPHLECSSAAKATRYNASLGYTHDRAQLVRLVHDAHNQWLRQTPLQLLHHLVSAIAHASVPMAPAAWGSHFANAAVLGSGVWQLAHTRRMRTACRRVGGSRLVLGLAFYRSLREWLRCDWELCVCFNVCLFPFACLSCLSFGCFMLSLVCAVTIVS